MQKLQHGRAVVKRGSIFITTTTTTSGSKFDPYSQWGPFIVVHDHRVRHLQPRKSAQRFSFMCVSSSENLILALNGWTPTSLYANAATKTMGSGDTLNKLGTQRSTNVRRRSTHRCSNASPLTCCSSNPPGCPIPTQAPCTLPGHSPAPQ